MERDEFSNRQISDVSFGGAFLFMGSKLLAIVSPLRDENREQTAGQDDQNEEKIGNLTKKFWQ